MGVRKSHAKMNAAEWRALLKALEGVRGLPLEPPAEVLELVRLGVGLGCAVPRETF